MRRTLLLPLLLLAACQTTPKEEHDYRAYLEHMPRSILVLPPLDTTANVHACYGWLGSVTRPLVERGYYVFPVAMVDAMLKDNGLPTAGEMHQIPLPKVREVFGADSVLYVTVTRWGTSYHVFNSATEVAFEARLVDVDSGVELWSGKGSARQDSNGGGGDVASMLIGALASQVAASATTPERDLARSVGYTAFHAADDGLLVGPYHPDFEKDQAARRAGSAAVPEAAAKAR